MRRSLVIAAALVLASPAMAADQLAKDVEACLVQARAALGTTMRDTSGRTQNDHIDAYVAKGKIYFLNPFVSPEPTFTFWKRLRLKGYDIPSQ